MTTETKKNMTSTMARSEFYAALSGLESDGVWVVGGAIRDALSGNGNERFDIDIAVAGADAWSQAAGESLGAPAVRISSRFDVWRIPLDEGQIDVWDLPDDDIERDLARRDFTVNAMAIPLVHYLHGDFTDALVDPHGGVDCIAERRLRLVSRSALSEDPVRMLRAVRLEAEGGWRPDAGVQSAIRRDAALIEESAAERRWEELRRILLSDRCSWAVRRMEQSGLLDVIVPELAHCRDVQQRPVHRRDVFWHQVDSLRWLTRISGDQQPRGLRAAALWHALAPLLANESIRLSLERWRLPIRLATLLHDIGKPDTRTVDADGSTHFFGHSELGAELAADRLRRLRVPGRLISQISLLIEQHLRPGQVNAPSQPPTNRALHRFNAALGDAAVPVCWLFLADSLATAGVQALLPRWPAYAAHVARIVTWQPHQPTPTGVLLDGHAIMEATGLSPGPMIGRIRAKIDEAAAVGEVTEPEEARRLARRLAKEMRDVDVAEAHRSVPR